MVSRKLDCVTPFPEGRRGHTAVIYKNTLYIFAGYIDMRRASNELWAFSFSTFLCSLHSVRLFQLTKPSAILIFIMCEMDYYLSFKRGC